MTMRMGWWAGRAALVALFAGAACAQTKGGAHLVVQAGDPTDRSCLALSNNDAYMAVGTSHGTIELWDVYAGRILRRLKGNRREVNAITFSRDGRYLLSGGDDGTARLWDVATGAEIRRFGGGGSPVTAIAFSWDGAKVAGAHGRFANVTKGLAIWDAASGKELLRTASVAGAVESLAFSPDGEKLLSRSRGGLTVFDTADGRNLRRFEDGPNEQARAIPSPDGRYVLMTNVGGKAQMRDPGSGEVLREFATEVGPYPGISANGRYIAAMNQRQVLAEWDSLSGSLLWSFPSRYGVTACFSSGLVLLDGPSSGGLVVDGGTRRVLAAFEQQASMVWAVAASSDGHSLLTGDLAGKVHLWDVSVGRQTRELNSQPGTVLGSAVNSVTFSPDGKSVLSVGDDAILRRWDLESGVLSQSLKDDAIHLQDVAVAPDGKKVSTGDHLWSLRDGKKLRELGGTYTSFSGDGRFVAVTHTSLAWVFAVAGTGPPRAFGKLRPMTEKVDEEDLNSVALSEDGSVLLTSTGNSAFSPDGRYVACVPMYKTTLWDTRTGKVRWTAEPEDGAGFNTVALLDATNGSRVWQANGHDGRVDSMTFAAIGKYLMTGSEDGTARLWKTATGDEIVSFATFDGGNWAVWDKDGRFDTNQLDGGAPMQWVLDDEPMRALPWEVFMRDYYTPGLLSRILNGEKLPDVRSIGEIKNRVQPDVKVVSVTASEKMPWRVDVVVHAASHTDEKGDASGLQDLRLFRDGQMVGSGWVDVPATCAGEGSGARRVAGGYIEGRLRDCVFTFHDVLLKSDAKKVEFTAYAFNSERIKSATAGLDYEPKTETAAAGKRRAYLVQVGVDHYAASGCELHDAVNDAEAMNAALRKRLETQGYAVTPVKLESLANGSTETASKSAIREQLFEIATRATPDDAFFLSFSGHGYSAADGQFYILPSSAVGTCLYPDEAQMKAMLAGAISANDLADWLRPIDAGEMTLILDACYSAESVQTGDFRPGPMGSRGLGQLAYDKRMRVLAASQSTDVAHEYDELGEGLLTYKLTHDGLDGREADWKPKDGKITVGEWLAYAVQAVPKFEPGSEHAAPKGVIPEKPGGKAATAVETTRQGAHPQVPALFDFSKADSFVLQ